MTRMALGAIRIDLIADVAKFTTGSKEATKLILKWRDSAKQAVGEVAGHVTAAARTFVNMRTAIVGVGAALGAVQFARGLDAAADKVDNIGKAAKRLGIQVEQLSALRFAAGESGVEFESLAKMAARAGKTIAEMVADGRTYARVGRINVALTDVSGNVRTIGELLPDLAKGIESAGSEAAQLNLAQKFFGREGGDGFITLLKESGTFVKGLAEQTERARRLGVIFTDDQVEKLTAYRDAVGRVQEAWLGVRVKLMTEVAPAITAFLDDMALRTAAIPRTVGALGAALGASAGSGPQATLAGRLLEAVGNSAKDVLLTAARASANVFVTILTEGVRNIGVNLAIEFSKALRGNPLVNYLIGDATTGSAAAIEELQQKRARIVAMRNSLNSAAVSGNVYLEEPRRRELTPWVRDVLNRPTATYRDVEEAIAALDKLIAAREKYLQLDEGSIAQQRVQVAAESARRIAETWQTSSADVERAIAGVSKAVQDLNASFASGPAGELLGPGLMGDTAAQEGRIAQTRRQYAEMVAGLKKFKDAGVQLWGAYTAKVDEGLKKTEPLYKANIDRITKAREALDHLRDSLDDVGQAQQMVAVALENWQLGLITFEEYDELVDRIYAKLNKLSEQAEETFGDKLRDTISGFASSASDDFADFVVDGTASLEDLAKAWTKTLVSMATQYLVFQPIFNALGNSVGVAFGAKPTPKTTNPVVGAPGLASGGPINPGRWYRVGENGPEWVRFGQQGRVYPNHESGGNVMVQVIDQRGGGAPVEVSEASGPGGQRQIQVLVRDEVRRQIAQGGLDRALGNNYGLTRRPASR